CEVWRGTRAPALPGLYRIRHVGFDGLDYVGQTGAGSMHLRQRMGMLRGVYGDVMHYRDRHAAGPQPSFGCRLVIRTKLYGQAVGSAMVRELFGAVHDAGASKGILITTSHFSSDAIKFAEGKPLELIDRQGLEALLREHGLRSRPMDGSTRDG